MDGKRLVVGTLVGAVTLFVTGYMLFGIVVPTLDTNFMNAGPATGAARQPALFWAIALGMLSYGLLVTLAIESRSGSRTVRSGMTAGAIVSLLVWFTADFTLYGITNVGHLTGIIVDPLLEAVPGAIAGGVIAVMFRTMSRVPITRDSSRVSDARAA